MAVETHIYGTATGSRLTSDVVRIHSGRLATALQRFRAHFEAGLSLTDWTSLVAMEDEGISSIATFDPAFAAWAGVVDGT